MEISKPIHFWNLQTLGNPKIHVAICTDTCKSAILKVQNGRLAGVCANGNMDFWIPQGNA